MILLPLIQVELCSEKEKLNTIGLLDSGATATFITNELASILDLIPEKLDIQDVSTAGGDASFFPIKIKSLSLLKGGAIFSLFNNLGVLVPSSIEKDLPYVILGRDTVFTRFNIFFNEKHKEFTLGHHKWTKVKLV